MMRKVNFRIILPIILVAIVAFVVLNIDRPDDVDQKYTVTAQQWQEALGDDAHIQTIYNNVTIEIVESATQRKTILATANGGLMLDNESQDMKLVCVPAGNSFVSYIYRYTDRKWEKYNGKYDSVDTLLNTYLPDYVDTAMAGLQDEFANAKYDEKNRCYIIKTQKALSSEEKSKVIHCKVFFENGQLARLETEIVSANTLTLKLYNIGKTKVEIPPEA